MLGGGTVPFHFTMPLVWKFVIIRKEMGWIWSLLYTWLWVFSCHAPQENHSCASRQLYFPCYFTWHLLAWWWWYWGERGYSPTFWVFNLRQMLWTWVGGMAFKEMFLHSSHIMLGQSPHSCLIRGSFVLILVFPAEIWFLLVPSGYSFVATCHHPELFSVSYRR